MKELNEKAMRVLESSIPELASERDDSCPLIIAGGAACFINPEPAAAFFDLIAIGEPARDHDRVQPSRARRGHRRQRRGGTCHGDARP